MYIYVFMKDIVSKEQLRLYIIFTRLSTVIGKQRSNFESFKLIFM